MEKKGRLSQVMRKRGRPRKIKPVEEEKLESSSEDDTFQQTGSCANASSSGPAWAQPDPLTVSWCQARYSKALADNEERLDQAISVPMEALTPRSPVQDLEQYSEHENICPDNNLPEMEATVDRNLQTCDHSTLPSAGDIPNIALVDTKSSENDEVISTSQLESSFIVFGGYKVKKEIVPLLKAIFTKYGDIAKNSTFSMESRSCLLELVCSIYKRLKASKFTQLTSLGLQSMLGQIGDLELVKVEVGWLHKRLLNISKARQLCDNVSTLEDVEARMRQEIDEKKKAVETCEKELESCMAAVKKLQERLNQEKDELFAAMALVDEIKGFSEGSLVKGLV